MRIRHSLRLFVILFVLGSLLASGTEDQGLRPRPSTLQEDGTFGGHMLPKGTIVYLHADGTLDRCFLPKPTRLEGHLCKGHSSEWDTVFHRNGKLRIIWLEEDELIQDIPCKRATWLGEMISGKKHSGVEFHPNGRLARARLSMDAQIQGVPLKEGDVVHFDEDGRLLPPSNS